MPRVIPVRTFSGLAILRKGFFATLPNPGRVGTDCTTLFRIVASDTFRNRQTFRVTVHGLYAVVTGLPCVFCIVSQNCDFVKNIFRFVASGTFSVQSDEVRTGHSTGHFVPVAVQPLFDCTRIVPQDFDFVKHYFCFRRKWFLTFTRGKGLFSAPLLQSALCAPVSARSARVHLVALTVGVMALFHLPGLSPVDFYWQSRVIVCGCVGA